MFKIDDLLGLFPNEKTRKMLVYSYYLSQAKDKEASDSVFEQFLVLKKMNPKINVILDSTKEKSYFNSAENTIYINNLSIETFFHELTHLLSYNYLNFQIPNEYYLFKRNFLASPDNESLVVQFLHLCAKEKAKFFQGFNNESVNDYKIKTLNEMNNVHQEPQSNQFDLISMIEDIVDSLYDGQSFSQGLVSIHDNNSYAVKAPKTAGHGCEYFSNNSFQFEEILANYQTIKLTDPKNELFILLKNILGAKFISFLEQRCSEICGKKSKIEFNNNISKK